MNIKQWLGRMLPASRMIRGAGILAGSQALAQALAILASPIITRLYTPDQFGLLATYMAIVSIITVVACLRYELAIALPEKDIDAFHIAVLAICSSSLFALICLFAVMSLKFEIAQWLNMPLLENYLFMVPVSVFLVGFYNSCRFWAIRKDRYPIIGKTRLTQVVGSLGVQITGSSLGELSLFLGQLASQLLGVFTLARIMITRTSISTLTLTRLRSALIRYKRFPLFSTWSALFNVTGTELPSLFLAVSFGPAAAGFYALASRVLRAPVTVISGSIASVFLSGAAKAHRSGGLSSLTMKVYQNLVGVAMPLMVLLAIIAPNLFSLVFGESWHLAGIFARWMSLWIFLVFVTSPLHLLFSVLERQDHEFIYQVTLFVVRFISLFVGVKMGGAVFSLALYCLSSAGCQLGFLLWLNRQLDISIRDLILPLLSAASWSALVCTPVLLYNFLPQGPTVFILCVFASSALLCGTLIVSLRRVSR